MFEDYDGTIDLIKVLYDEYKYIYNGDDYKLLQQPFIELEGDGVDAFIWIIYKGERYLFKNLQDAEYNVWGELLSKQLAKKMGLPCAKYRACKLGTHYGIITENILLNRYKLVLGAELMQQMFNNYKYLDSNIDLLENSNFREIYNLPDSIIELSKNKKNKILFSYLNNIEDIWSILGNLNFNSYEIRDIINGLVKYLIFDCISLQRDRHPNNWGIILENNSYSFLCPLFDNSTSFGLGKSNMSDYIKDFNQEVINSKWRKDNSVLESMVYEGYPNLTISSEMVLNQNNEKANHLKVLSTLLAKTSTDDRNRYLYLFKNISEDTIDELISKVELENDIKIDSSLYLYVSTIWKVNIRNITDILKKYSEVVKNERYVKNK